MKVKLDIRVEVGVEQRGKVRKDSNETSQQCTDAAM